MTHVEHDTEMQRKYDEKVNRPSIDAFLTKCYDPFESDELYFVSGQNAYFNTQIDEHGLNHLALEDEDADIIAALYYLASPLYGHPNNYGRNNNSILYVTPPGTIELGYARQSFPSGILEDIFLWQGNKKYPFPWHRYGNEIVQLIAGEKEFDYWMRVVEKQIEMKRKEGRPLKIGDRTITNEELNSFKIRLYNVFKKFCSGKNRLYFLPLLQLMDNKASYFVEKIREGSMDEEEYRSTVNSMDTLKQIIDASDSTSNDLSVKSQQFLNSNVLRNPVGFGLAILGEIQCTVKYVEVKTIYALLQEYFLSHGYKNGEPIDYNEIYKLFDERELPNPTGSPYSDGR